MFCIQGNMLDGRFFFLTPYVGIVFSYKNFPYPSTVTHPLPSCPHSAPASG